MTEDIKIEENSESGKNVVEKRVKSTIIRRRKVQPKPEDVAPEEQSAAETSAGEPSTEAQAAVGAGAEKTGTEATETSAAQVKGATGGEKTHVAGKTQQVEEKRKSLKIIAQPDEVEKPVAPPSGPVGIAMPEKDIERLIKRPARKKKSKAELQYEDIRKVGGLMQYAIETIAPEDAASTLPTKSRVFEPGLRPRKKKSTKKGKKTEITEPKAIKKVIRLSDGISVSELSQSMGVKANELIKKLMGLGIMATVNQTVDSDTATLLAGEYGYEVENVGFNEDDHLQVSAEKIEGKLLHRPPVVTVMGHVDHGKTSILDVIRSANVAEGEAGGITQHIGAYTVMQNDKPITFVDTPGHAAFTHMRARGAQVTDIVILVVAADDGVMPQTKEAINHARAAGVPLIIAINKIDKPNANIEKVKRELSENGLQPEDWGGDTICVPTSAKAKTGIDQLLEMVLLQAEILELKARYEGRAEGIVIESKMDRQRGPVVTCVVKQGTLRQGDPLVSGVAWGRAKRLYDDKGTPVSEVGPSGAVEILGLSDVPEAGEKFFVVENEKSAKLVAENRIQKNREESLSRRSRVTLEDLKAQISHGEAKGLNLIIKTDVKGVSDAVRDSLPGLSTPDVKINVLHTGVGGINESDIMLASASNAVVLGFNVVADTSARELAAREGVEIKRYSIIYEMLEDVKKSITGMLKPREVETILGRAEVRDTFKVPKAGIVAGCMVTNGKITRNASLRILRDNVIIHDGKISSLRRFKDDVKEVAAGQECGIGIEKFIDIKVGDELEAYIIEKIEVTWEESKEKANVQAEPVETSGQ